MNYKILVTVSLQSIKTPYEYLKTDGCIFVGFSSLKLLTVSIIGWVYGTYILITENISPL